MVRSGAMWSFSQVGTQELYCYLGCSASTSASIADKLLIFEKEASGDLQVLRPKLLCEAETGELVFVVTTAKISVGLNLQRAAHTFCL